MCARRENSERLGNVLYDLLYTLFSKVYDGTFSVLSGGNQREGLVLNEKHMFTIELQPFPEFETTVRYDLLIALQREETMRKISVFHC